MRRRQVLKRIGASSALAVGATGFASAQHTGTITASEANYLTTEVDGEMRDFTFEEFEQHPDTPSLADVDLSGTCCYECKECCNACCHGEVCCWGRECGRCPSC